MLGKGFFLAERQYKNGDDSFGESLDSLFFHLFMTHRKSLYAFILASIHNYNDADDILQETATVMWRKFSEFEQGTDFVAWGITIARIRVLKFFNERQRTRVQFGDKLMEQILSTTSSKVGQVDARLEASRNCRKKLSDSDQNLLYMRYNEGLTIKKIADKLGRPLPGLYKSMGRLHSALLRCIKRSLAGGEVTT